MEDGDKDDQGRRPDEEGDEPLLQMVEDFKHGDSPAGREPAPTQCQAMSEKVGLVLVMRVERRGRGSGGGARAASSPCPPDSRQAHSLPQSQPVTL